MRFSRLPLLWRVFAINATLLVVATLVLVHVGTEAERRLEAVARGVGRETETRVAAGDHAEALARVAAEEGADLVVVGGRAAGLGGRNLRWTLARELEAATPVPVLIAPPATRRRSDHRLASAAGAATR